MKLRSLIVRLTPHGLALFMAAIFLDSLRYKFTDHPKTQVIFGLLNGWAGSIGLEGLFAHTGLFSQYVIGSIELLASTLLVVGILHHREVVLHPVMNIQEAIAVFDAAEAESLAVVEADGERRPVGILTEAHAMRRYAEESDKRRREAIGEV